MNEGYPSDASRRRRLKREVWGAPRRFRASCALGLEEILHAEVAALPEVHHAVARPGEVAFDGAFEAVYAALLRLRSADTLRLSLGEMPAETFPMLFDQLTRLSWPLFLPPRCDLEVRVRSRKSRLRDADGLERTLRKAVAGQGIETRAHGAPRLTVVLELWRDRAEAWLDAAGDPLHRRWGDKWVARTSLRETTAAAVGLFASVGDADLVVDPFCGSGTLLLEAADLIDGTCPGGRRPYALQGSPCFKPERMRHAWRRDCVDAEDHAASNRAPRPPLLGSDVDADALEAARANVERAGRADQVRLERWDAREVDLPGLARAVSARTPMIVSNPPYGRRARAVGGDPGRLLAEVLRAAPGWRFALVYPVPAHAEAVPGVQVEEARPVRMRGLRTHLIRGWVKDGS